MQADPPATGGTVSGVGVVAGLEVEVVGGTGTEPGLSCTDLFPSALHPAEAAIVANARIVNGMKRN
jgi:hypothetical protein